MFHEKPQIRAMSRFCGPIWFETLNWNAPWMSVNHVICVSPIRANDINFGLFVQNWATYHLAEKKNGLQVLFASSCLLWMKSISDTDSACWWKGTKKGWVIRDSALQKQTYCPIYTNFAKFSKEIITREVASRWQFPVHESYWGPWAPLRAKLQC